MMARNAHRSCAKRMLTETCGASGIYFLESQQYRSRVSTLNYSGRQTPVSTVTIFLLHLSNNITIKSFLKHGKEGLKQILNQQCTRLVNSSNKKLPAVAERTPAFLLYVKGGNRQNRTPKILQGDLILGTKRIIILFLEDLEWPKRLIILMRHTIC